MLLNSTKYEALVYKIGLRGVTGEGLLAPLHMIKRAINLGGRGSKINPPAQKQLAGLSG